MIDILTAVVGLLAEEPRNTGPEFGKAAPFGLLITVLLLVRKLPESFDSEHPEPDQAADEGTLDADSEDGTTKGAD
mgnify:CR=1 FL=1